MGIYGADILSFWYLSFYRRVYFMPEKPQILFVLGGPGSGKGTLCDIMKNDYGFKHFSVGELIR